MLEPPSDLELLCRWLNSDIKDNTPESDRHFHAYFQYFAGIPGHPGPLLKFLARRLGPSPKVSPEDLLQDIFERAVTLLKERPAIAKHIQQTVPALSLPARGEVFQQGVKRWGGEMNIWTKETMNFSAANIGLPADQQNENAKRIRDTLIPLRIKGASFLDWVDNAIEVAAFFADEIPEAEVETFDDETEKAAVYPRQRIESLVKQVTKLRKIQREAEPNLDRAEANANAKFGVEGATLFIEQLGQILIASPRLRIPTKTLLYHIATNLVYSHYGAKSTQNETSLDDDETLFKTAYASSSVGDDKGLHQDFQTETLGERQEGENSTGSTQEKNDSARPDSGDAPPASPHVYQSQSIHAAVFEQCKIRYAHESESWQLQQSAYAFLLVPVMEAKQAIRSARTKQEIQQAEKRYAKRRKRYKAHVLTYDLMMEGFDENLIGQALGMSSDDIEKRKVKELKSEVRALLAPLKELIKG